QDDVDVIQSGEPKLGIVELYQTPSGGKRWVQTDKVPYRDPAGTIIGVLVFAQDITERRKAEEALQREKNRVEEGQEAISRESRTGAPQL
ncbi:MAG TPA: PAS domain-containing protein, partial [Nitrospiraceae bacterium]|nr:PAS domain-containing protein [Nitrospiraceae bacterium]